MKIDRYNPNVGFAVVKHLLASWITAALFLQTPSVLGGDAVPVSHGEANLGSAHQDASPAEESEPEAEELIAQVLKMLVHGPAFDAKVRQTVWTGGREVVGVGTYEQAGGGSGLFNLQLTMHDGTGKHRLQQISDGRLAWTRTEIAGTISLRRVDVGRLNQWVRGATEDLEISPALRVGAWAEMLSEIQREFVLRVDSAHLEREPVWVITAQLKQERRRDVMRESGRQSWPPLYPTQVRVAVRAKGDQEGRFGQLLPVRLEYWSDPLTSDGDAGGRGRLIALIELYSIRPIARPHAQRFRFENQDAEVNFINETDRYIERYGVQLTQRQRQQLRR